jgi:DNA-binding transcriptional MerR regulator
MNANKDYSISDLSREFDITTRTLRFYEEKGLINPVRKGQNRIYSAADRTRIRLILRGKRLGLTLQESSDIISMYDPASNNRSQLQALIEKIREKKQQLASQQEDLDAMIIDLESWEQRYLEVLDETPQKNRGEP